MNGRAQNRRFKVRHNMHELPASNGGTDGKQKLLEDGYKVMYAF